MNTQNPLAAALLLIAASASAQPLAGGYNFSGGQTATPFSFGAASGPVDDIVFKCGTVPYIACTAEHMNKRENIRITGFCPAPATPACTEYLMSTRGAANPVETIAAYDPPPGREWASPDCQRIPCRLADPPASSSPPPAPGAGAVESGLPYDQQPGFIGPPAPPSGPAMPPPFSAADFQRELADARSDMQNTVASLPVVDLGDNRYGIVLEDGTVAVCGKGLCSTPRPASEFPNLADQIQAARSLNNGDSINKENPGGFTPTSNKQPPATTPPGESGRSGQDNTPPHSVASNPTDEARGSGNDAGSFFRSNGGGASAGGTSGGGYAAAAANGKEEAIATEAAELDGVFTYIKTQQIKAAIDRTAGAVTTGGDGTFVTPTTTPDANAGDLQFRGTQSGANR